jgi:hypothetical protein
MVLTFAFSGSGAQWGEPCGTTPSQYTLPLSRQPLATEKF